MPLRTKRLLASILFLWSGGAVVLQAAENAAQQVLLSPLEAASPIDKGGWKMGSLAAGPAPTQITPKVGERALRLGGVAEAPGAKGDFTLAHSVPGRCRSLSLWVYLEPGANVQSVGLQIYDAEGEAFLSQIPADWIGWKQFVVDFQGSVPAQAYDQPQKNHKVDFPLASVHLAWFAKAAGSSSVIVDALTASVDPTETPRSLDVQVSGAAWGEPGKPLAAQTVVLTNFAATDSQARIDYVIQRDPAFFSAPPPDPDYGPDNALGAKSWTEAEGKTLSEDR